MGFGVVCISRTAAAGGEDIGHAVAQRLGFRYVDEQVIERAAQQAEVDPAQVAAAEHRQPLLQRLLDKLAIGANRSDLIAVEGAVPVVAVAPLPASYKPYTNDLRVLIRAAIHEIAGAGQAVIVAHAASMALGPTDGVLRVLVTASTDTRIRRVAEWERIIKVEAERRIVASDREREDYFQRFYKLQEKPTHYDLVINTDVLTTAQAVDVILAAVRERRLSERVASRGILGVLRHCKMRL